VASWSFNSTTRASGAGRDHLYSCPVVSRIRSPSASEARLLTLHAPAMDAYFEELSALWSGSDRPPPEAERELMRRHGMEPA
jgi:hypothetical protein